MWKHQTAVTIIVSGLIALLIGGLRPLQQVKSEEAFWAMKIAWGSDYDMVLAGDSRVWQGLSPSAMNTIIADDRIINFGFDLISYSGEYLEATERLLDPGSDRKTIVLGITPLSFTPRAERENKYLELKSKHAVELSQQIYLQGFFSFFRPLDLQENKHLRATDHRGRQKVFHDDGFVACTMEPPQPRRSIDHYSKLFIDNIVQPEVVDELMAKIREWRSKEIDVYAFRVPTSLEMVELENRISGFDESSFARQIQESGGQWLVFPHAGYFAYDGSHLRSDSARKLSRRLAREIQKLRKQKR